MATDFLDYPKGRWALGAGDLLDVFDVSVQMEDGETAVTTLRRNPGGSTGGKRVAKATFKMAISEEGFERDYMGKWRKREVVEGRLKVPGLTFAVKGRFTAPQIMSNIDSFVEFQITILGKNNEAKV